MFSIYYHGAVPSSQFFPLFCFWFCFGLFPHYGPAYRSSKPTSVVAASSTLSQSPQSWSPDQSPQWYYWLPKQSCTTPPSQDFTSPGTKVEIKAAAKIASTGTFKYYAKCNSVYIYLLVAVSGVLKTINAHKCNNLPEMSKPGNKKLHPQYFVHYISLSLKHNKTEKIASEKFI